MKNEKAAFIIITLAKMGTPKDYSLEELLQVYGMFRYQREVIASISDHPDPKAVSESLKIMEKRIKGVRDILQEEMDSNYASFLKNEF